MIGILAMLNPFLNQLNSHRTEPRALFKVNGTISNHYTVIGSSLIKSESLKTILKVNLEPRVEALRVMLSTIPTVALELYLVDLMDPRCTDTFLKIEKTHSQLRSFSIFGLSTVILCMTLASAMLALHIPNGSIFLGVLLLSLWLFLNKPSIFCFNRRSDFAVLLTREIARRRGKDNRTPKRVRYSNSTSLLAAG